jgi:hypothetical protein
MAAITMSASDLKRAVFPPAWSEAGKLCFASLRATANQALCCLISDILATMPFSSMNCCMHQNVYLCRDLLCARAHVHLCVVRAIVAQGVLW